MRRLFIRPAEVGPHAVCRWNDEPPPEDEDAQWEKIAPDSHNDWTKDGGQVRSASGIAADRFGQKALRRLRAAKHRLKELLRKE